MMYCTQCGSEIAIGARFCGSCGAAVHAVGLSLVRAGRVSRPVWVWVVAGWYLLSAVFTLAAIVAWVAGVLPVPASRAYLESLGALDYLGGVVVGAISLWGVSRLFWLRADAVWWLGVSFVGHIVVTLLNLFAHASTVTALSDTALLGWLLAWVLLGAVWLAAVRLQSRGILS